MTQFDRRPGGRDRAGRPRHWPGDLRRSVTPAGRVEPDKKLLEEVAARVDKFARPKRTVWVEDLPKTSQDKILRQLLRDIAEGRALGDATTLRDPSVMCERGKQMVGEGDEGSG